MLGPTGKALIGPLTLDSEDFNRGFAVAAPFAVTYNSVDHEFLVLWGVTKNLFTNPSYEVRAKIISDNGTPTLPTTVVGRFTLPPFSLASDFNPSTNEYAILTASTKAAHRSITLRRFDKRGKAIVPAVTLESVPDDPNTFTGPLVVLQYVAAADRYLAVWTALA
jgi:hypothetical protein